MIYTCYSHQRNLMVSYKSLRHRKSPQISRTLLSILADINDVVVWRVFTCSLISKSSSPCTKPLVTVPSEPIRIGISIFIFHSFFQFSSNVTLRPSPPHALHQSSNHFASWPAGDQLVVRGGQRTFLANTRIRSGGQEKIKQTNKHEQCLGLTQSRRRVCNTTCMCGLTLAWVTSENSTSNWNADILTQSSSLDPFFSATVSGVDRICPSFHANSSADSPLCCPVANYLPAPLSSQLSFASPYHFQIRRDFRFKNPLSGFAPKQTKESSAWRATHIVLQ